MTMQTRKVKIIAVYSLFNGIKSLSCFESETKFAVNLTCPYEIVSMSINTGFYAEKDIWLFIQISGDIFKAMQLADIIDNDMTYIILNSESQFLISFVIAVETDFLDRETCFKGGIKFAY